MQKKLGATLLVAGTCIGSGMIALPMMLAKLGIVPSVILMIITWLVIYYTSLVNIELNLQAGRGLALGALGKKFSGKIAGLIGVTSFKVISYSLLSVYMSGGASVLAKMLESNTGYEYSFNHIASIYALFSVMLLLLPIKLVDYINRILFTGLLAVVGILIIGIISTVNWSNLPLFSQQYGDIRIWQMVIPVLFTAFGFQVIFHTLTDYCNKDVKMLKFAFLWGSLVPAIIYVIWTFSILVVVYQDSPIFYYKMIDGQVEIGDLIKELSNIAKWPLLKHVIWWITSFAIITSVLGVGVGLRDSVKEIIFDRKEDRFIYKFISAVITMLPAYLVAVFIPNAFISVLGFAGMILVVIAILLPIYLFYKADVKNPYYKELKVKSFLILSAIIGIVIIICEIANMT